MSRNLVVCFDGTSNALGRRHTNVVRLIQLLDPRAADQQVFYDPGAGSLPAAALGTRLHRRMLQVADVAMVAGIDEKLERAYRHLMNTWQPGDHVYVFGFSRGAYTARLLCGMLNTVGLLHAHCDNLVTSAMQLFAAVRAEREKTFSRRTCEEMADNFRLTFARDVPDRTDRRFTIHFLGVWDTVTSIGMPWDPASYPQAAGKPTLEHVRHAVALDERRAFYRPSLVHARAGRDVREMWFAGHHGDVGGGLAPQQSGICSAALGWMADEASAVGLAIDCTARCAIVPNGPIYEQQLHDSLRGAWNLAELCPKPAVDIRAAENRLRPNLWRGRYVPPDSRLHRSLVERLYFDPRYNPPNLKQEFVNKLRSGPTPQMGIIYR